MALITLIAEAKAVLRISSLDDDSSLPDIEAAEEKYIIPIIGQALYDELHTAYINDALSEAQTQLLQRIRKPLAAYAYYDDLALQHAMITDAGVRRTTTDNMPTAYRWEFEGVKDALLEKATTGVETLLSFLDIHAQTFTAWKESDQYIFRSKQLIKNAYEFSSQYKLHQPNRTFNSLMSIMGDVEMMYIHPSIGKEFYTDLLSETNLSDHQKELLILLKKAMAHLTIYHAFEKLTVRMTSYGPTIYDRYQDRLETDSQPTPDLMSFAMKSALRDGQSYLAKAKDYLNRNATADIFPLYFASDFYKPSQGRKDPNQSLPFYTFIR